MTLLQILHWLKAVWLIRLQPLKVMLALNKSNLCFCTFLLKSRLKYSLTWDPKTYADVPRFVAFGHNLQEMVSCGESFTPCAGFSGRIGGLVQMLMICAHVTVILRFRVLSLDLWTGKLLLSETTGWIKFTINWEPDKELPHIIPYTLFHY